MAMRYEKLPWNHKISLRLFWTPEDFCPISHLPVYQQFSDTEKLQLNHCFSLGVLEHIAFMETAVLKLLANRSSEVLARRELVIPEERSRIERMWLEESLHVHLFRRLLDATREVIGKSESNNFGRQHRRVEMLARVAGVLPPDLYILSWLHLGLYLEELEFYYSARAKSDKGLDPLHRTVLWHHAKDESQHILINASIIQKLVDVFPASLVRLNETVFLFVITQVFCSFRSNWRDWKRWVRSAPGLQKYSPQVKHELRVLVRSQEFRRNRLNRRVLPQTFSLLEKTGHLNQLEKFVSGRSAFVPALNHNI